MKKTPAILLLLLSGALSAFSQNVDREIFPEQVSITHNQAVKSFSGDFVTMTSSVLSESRDFPEVVAQTAIVNQIGMANLVLLSQQGALNYARISTVGHHNHVDWNQIGNHNQMSVRLVGNHNGIIGLQEGNSNQLMLAYEGDGLDQDFIQLGNNQFLEFFGIGIPVTVIQRGDGATLTIENR